MELHQNEKNILFLHELGHLDACERFLNENPDVRNEGYLVIAFGLEIEYALARKGIPFLSGRAYRPADSSRFQSADRWATWFDSAEWNWFRYRDVALSQMFFFSIRNYLLYLLYYATIFGNVLMRHPAVRRLVVFPSPHALHVVPPGKMSLVREQPLLREQLAAVVACAKLIGGQHGVEVLVPKAVTVPARRVRFSRLIFAVKRLLLEFVISMYNAGMTMLRPRGTPRILASDYWRNIAPIMSQLPRGELMLFDRGEAFQAGIRELWRSRVRLYNFGSFSIRDRKKDRTEAQRAFEESWRDIREHRFADYSFNGFSLRPLLLQACEEIVTTVAPRTLYDIDGAYALIKGTSPDMVFLRASISLQTHFNILAQVARASGIPSLELQHGLEYLGPDSYSKRHSAEYIAVYGRVVQDEFATLGFSREKLPIVGSPRFDVYEKTSLAHTSNPEGRSMSVLCVGTVVGDESVQDEYDLEDYYRAIARALEKIPNSSVVIKLRPGPAREDFYRSAIDTIFVNVPHTIAQYESPAELLAAAGIVVSYYSTFVLEALQWSKPTIVFSTEGSIEKEMIRFHFAPYAGAGGLLLSYTQEDLDAAFRSLANDDALRSRMSERAGEVLAERHSFDGQASERIVELIERLSRKQNGYESN